MKVLGAKVSDETYNRFKALCRPISDSLRDAIALYLEHVDSPKIIEVNHTEATVNCKTHVHEDQDTPSSSKLLNDVSNSFKGKQEVD